MEISRKKISDEEIYESEKKLAEEATKISEDFKEKFSSIGYELETEFSRENENLTEEKRKELSALSVLSVRGRKATKSFTITKRKNFSQ